MTTPAPGRAVLLAEAEDVAREAVALVKEGDLALHTAELVRSGKWDHTTEVAWALVGARATVIGSIDAARAALRARAEPGEGEQA